MTTNVRVADQIIEQLEREGVTHIFGVPGAPLTPFFAALRARSRIKFVMARHEEGAAYMANAFARVSGGLAVCCVTSGPGATNALTGAACAHADSLPVLYLTGQVATRVFGMGAIQESTAHGVDVVSMFRPVTKVSTMLSSPETSLRIVRNAIRAATNGRPGPVHINVPTDLARSAVAYDVLDRSCYQQALKGVASAQDIASAATLLSAAKRPTIFAGHGVALANAESALVQLAERLDAAVITSPKGKGVFPEHHPLSLGVFGMGGHARADAWLESHDVILVVGSSLNEFASGAWNRRLRAERGVIHIDVDPSEIGKNYPVALGLHGDAGETLTALRLALGAATERGTQRRIAEISATVPRWEQAEHRRSSSAPIAPPRLVGRASVGAA
jgi:acetolactate synthase-1/2/3 large subunit